MAMTIMGMVSANAPPSCPMADRRMKGRDWPYGSATMSAIAGRTNMSGMRNIKPHSQFRNMNDHFSENLHALGAWFAQPRGPFAKILAIVTVLVALPLLALLAAPYILGQFAPPLSGLKLGGVKRGYGNVELRHSLADGVSIVPLPMTISSAISSSAA